MTYWGLGYVILQPSSNDTEDLIISQMGVGLVRATQEGTFSQTATFSVALPSDETLSTLALVPTSRSGASAATQAWKGTVQISRRISRFVK